jgi:phosphopantothenoylcysteine synthetase/decarboxylase
MIAANRVGQDGVGFGSENNELLVMVPGGEKNLGKGSKRLLAQLLIAEIAAGLNGSEHIETGPDKDTRPAPGN